MPQGSGNGLARHLKVPLGLARRPCSRLAAPDLQPHGRGGDKRAPVLLHGRAAGSMRT
ncbi:MAG: hypothetical protein WKG07_28940 [Hymenobacter sp.]